MFKYAIELSYDGSDYCGWQAQRGQGIHQNAKPSIEEKLAEAINGLCRQTPTIVSSGRTDSGVHASGQVAHFSLEPQSMPEENMRRGLNNLLPGSIQIHQLGRVPDDFRANQACCKQYSYYFQRGPSNLPHLKNYTMWNRYPLNGELMNEAVQYLIGQHDFFSFCSTGANVATTVRTIFEAEVTRLQIPQPGCFDSENQYLWQVRMKGSGFLKQMVRSIAGTLKQIGEERRPPTDIVNLLNHHSREKVGPTAPSSGLWLDRVWYQQQAGIDFLHQSS